MISHTKTILNTFHYTSYSTTFIVQTGCWHFLPVVVALNKVFFAFFHVAFSSCCSDLMLGDSRQRFELGAAHWKQRTTNICTFFTKDQNDY
jgi:hypothetical protein